MLFNSYTFLFGFLPLALGAFFVVSRWVGPRAGLASTIFASLCFYAYWNPRYLALLLTSITVNYVAGDWLFRLHQRADTERVRTRVVTAAVIFNLGLLGYFKYANFFVDTVAWVTGRPWHFDKVLLPLAISFFTFQQISYVVDAGRGNVRRYSPLEYGFLVTFFPHLIAGPIVQHRELLAQLSGDIFRPQAKNLSVGASLLVFGLFKKVVVADALAPLVSPVYGASAPAPTMVAAWVATIAYTLQLYFDFSGYSDMAIGLARLWNLKFPNNFNSPYKATSIIDFWRRWHLTLSRFLREYLYIPLGGNRLGPVRRQVNLFITMFLGGLWHGAGWGFALWGSLNGVYLIINHAYRQWRGVDDAPPAPEPWYQREAWGLFTIVFVMLSRVFFRSPTFTDAWRVLHGLVAVSTLTLASVRAVALTLVVFAALWVFVRVMPNTQEVLSGEVPLTPPPPPSKVVWTPSLRWAVAVGTLACASLLSLTRVSEFLYFQF